MMHFHAKTPPYVDIIGIFDDNPLVMQSVEQIVRVHKRISRKVRLENRDPAKAAAFLLRAGIAEKTKKSKTHPYGVRLAKRFR